MENQPSTSEEKMIPQTNAEQNTGPQTLDVLINKKIEELETILKSSENLNQTEREIIAKQAISTVEQTMENPSSYPENAALQKLEELLRMAKGEAPKKETEDGELAKKKAENNIVSFQKTETSRDPSEKKDEIKITPVSLKPHEAGKKLTEDALHILADAERVPLLRSSELRKIAEANGIDMLPEDTPENIIQKLKDMRDGIVSKKTDAPKNAKNKEEEKGGNVSEANILEESLKQWRKDRVDLRADIFVEEGRSKNGKQTSSEESTVLKTMRNQLAVLEQQITEAEKKEKQYQKDGFFAQQAAPVSETKIIDTDKQKEIEENKTNETPEKPPYETKKEESEKQEKDVESGGEKIKKGGFFSGLFALFARKHSRENDIVDLEDADNRNSKKTNVAEKIPEIRDTFLATEEKPPGIADGHLPHSDEKNTGNASKDKNIPVTIKIVSEKEEETKSLAELPETSIGTPVSGQKEKEETTAPRILSVEESIKKLGEPYTVKNEHSVGNILVARFLENEYFKKLPSRAQNFMIDAIADDVRHLSNTELQEMGMPDAPNIHPGDTLRLQKIIEKKKGNIMSAFRAHGVIS